MRTNLAFPTLLLTLVGGFMSTATAAPGGPARVQNPSFVPRPEPVRVDLSAPRGVTAEYLGGPTFEDLDAFARDDSPTQDDPPPDGFVGQLPEGLAQVGGMIVPREMLDGAAMVPDAALSLSAEGGNTNADIEEICAFPEAVPPGIYDYDHRPGGETPRFHTVYLNFLGGVLMSGGENSAENLSGIARSGHEYPVYSGGEARAIAAAQAVQVDLERWAVRVVYLERPPKVLPYTMVMMGGHYSDTTAGPSGGVAPLDCEDFGQRNVCYVFLNSASSTAQANVASQEIGHTLGLGHTQASDSVMASGYAPTQGGDLGFNDSCASTIQVADQGAACVGVNKCHCGNGEEQHDVNTLFATFSPEGPDMVEPTIAITQPEDGAEFSTEDDIVIGFDPWDDVGGYGWKLVVEDDSGEVVADQVDYDRALEFVLENVPAGTYTLTALIQDHADHVATHSIRITVHGVEGDTDTDTDTDDGPICETCGETETESGFTGGDTDAGTEGDGDSDGAAQDGASDEGCGCTAAPRPGPATLLLGLGLLGLWRRRR